jgi:5-carboxymethyl-2-hydroxymuconate isomerase
MMPHFIVDCSENVLTMVAVEKLLHEIRKTAESTGLFKPDDIKVRVRSFDHFTVAGTGSDFIHVFGNIMEGRTVEQKASLSRRIIGKLMNMFPEVPVISMNVSEFEKSSYCNRNML